MINYLHSVFVEFYCLPIENILALLIAATWIFVRLWEAFRRRWQWRLFLSAVLFAFTLVIVYLTISQRDGASNTAVFLVPFHSYREVLAGGNPEIYRSNFMNAVLFYPSGLLLTALLPKKWRGWCRCILVVLLFAALSAGIEYVQFHFGLGWCEIDDVIHNTAGALAGSLAALWVPSLLVWLNGKVKLMWAQYDHYRK